MHTKGVMHAEIPGYQQHSPCGRVVFLLVSRWEPSLECNEGPIKQVLCDRSCDDMPFAESNRNYLQTTNTGCR
jgi:hypothetical protein